jgi:hypothetical protein
MTPWRIVALFCALWVQPVQAQAPGKIVLSQELLGERSRALDLSPHWLFRAGDDSS